MTDKEWREDAECWLCNCTIDAMDFRDESAFYITVEADKPHGKHTDPHDVPVHFGCYMDIDP
jgi:hypothetical protein